MQTKSASAATNTSQSPAWLALQQHQKKMSQQQMRQLFAEDANRFERFHVKLNDVLLDFSKNIITSDTMALLQNLAQERNVSQWIARLFAGEKINHTEDRAVLHMALRNLADDEMLLDGANIIPLIRRQLARMEELSDSIRQSRWLGASGKPITDVVNIGIGGSDLGPKMATEALRPYSQNNIGVHFVSNLDENHINDTLQKLNPETTLFIVSSKTFTTLETLTNAHTARDWVLEQIKAPALLARHFLAVSSNKKAAIEFGIHPDNVLDMWDWVGGRYSLWSTIGLPIAISVGMDNFRAMLRGAYEVDQHFRTAPLAQNIPVIMALLGVWYINFFGATTHAILPYDEHMKSFPAYLQQADMESNGKYVDRDGHQVDYATGPVIFGEIGIKGQHAFYQLFHQGTHIVPADFLAPITDIHCIACHHRPLMANVFAQTEALMKGRTREEAVQEMQQQGLSHEQIAKLLPYRIFPGNRPTNTFLFQTLDPRTLGALIAMYEHKIFVQGVIWNINSFDQWGVELGKKLAKEIIDELQDDKPVSSHDSSTNHLINYYKQNRPK